MTDDKLSQRLRAARPTLAFPADFQQEIWGRIEAAELAGSDHFFARLLGWLARPLPALAVLVLMAGVGCLAGIAGQKRETPLATESSYVKSVSPFAAAKVQPPR